MVITSQREMYKKYKNIYSLPSSKRFEGFTRYLKSVGFLDRTMTTIYEADPDTAIVISAPNKGLSIKSKPLPSKYSEELDDIVSRHKEDTLKAKNREEYIDLNKKAEKEIGEVFAQMKNDKMVNSSKKAPKLGYKMPTQSQLSRGFRR